MAAPIRSQPKSSVLARVPVFLWLVMIVSLAMSGPALHALNAGDHATARAFFYAMMLGLLAAGLLALALSNRAEAPAARGQLLSLVGAYAVLPLLMAIPFREALGTTTFLNAWLEMISAFTTTGASLFAPERLSDSLHLWRATVGWLGGLLTWVAAAAILAPLSLGGFEVTAVGASASVIGHSPEVSRREAARRLRRTGAMLVPTYIGLTFAAMICLLIAGEAELVAICHAMSIMATSGISPVGGLEYAESGRAGEAVLLCFFIFAITRLSFSSDTTGGSSPTLRRDPELQIAVVATMSVVTLLFLRHWMGALDLSGPDANDGMFQAFWGMLFTAVSFLTTTGFVSADWARAQDWSGFGSPGLLLMALTLLGGGVATTAGGIKLLRVFALYQHGRAEMERLAHPSAVPRPLRHAVRIRPEGAYLAWLFFMIFVLSIGLILLALTMLGTRFDDALLLTVAALTTTGPLIEAAGESRVLFELSTGARWVLAFAMVLGKLEALALLALFNPSLWRK